jgi:2-polyprenyl-6-methoxyphenol hydroxylase and related FAD-dependent oxidoreductases
MNFSICGAGPGGLYLGILLKRADPGHRVVISERNPPGATYGWGVVFSDESLAELRDADYETYLAIDEALVRWNAIDIHYAGRCIRAYGHGFAAIARTELLRILTERAVALGVDVRHEHEVADLDALVAGDAGGSQPDVVVGADGVRSVVRAALEEPLGTTLTPTPAVTSGTGRRSPCPSSPSSSCPPPLASSRSTPIPTTPRRRRSSWSARRRPGGPPASTP